MRASSAVKNSVQVAPFIRTVAPDRRRETRGRIVPLRKLTGAELGRPRAHYRHSNPILPGQMYVYRQQFWDTYQVVAATASTSQTLFTIPRGGQYTPPGGSAYQKTFYHTNMTQASLFSQPNKLYIRAMNLEWRNDTFPTDAVLFNYDVLVTLIIAARTYAFAPASRFPAGGGLSTASTAAIANGWPTKDNAFVMYGPIGETVEQGQDVQVTLDPTQAIAAAGSASPATAFTPNTNGPGLNVRVYLDGQFFRSLG